MSLLYFYLGQIFILILLNFLLFIFFKYKQYLKIILVFSLIYIIFILINIIKIYNNDFLFLNIFSFYLIFDLLFFLFFIFCCIYILTFFLIPLQKVADAMIKLSCNDKKYEDKIKVKKNLNIIFNNYSSNYQNLNMIFLKIIEMSKELTHAIPKHFENLIYVKKEIIEQDNTINNFINAMNILENSAVSASKGLLETRTMFMHSAEKFNILFDHINILFSQNQLMQSENEDMEKSSISAIKFSIDLNDITKSGTKKIDTIIGFIDNFTKSVKKIVQMVNQIKKISSQTNLLAINASIEAAHAGDKGKGFAVIADEIRSLSISTSNVTNKISDIVTNITQELDKDQASSKSAKQGIEEINIAFSKNINFINQLADSINQQIENVEKMRKHIESLHNLSTDIKSQSEYQQKSTQEIYEATEILNSQTFLLKELANKQKLNIELISNSLSSLDQFIDNINIHLKQLPELIKNYDEIISKT